MQKNRTSKEKNVKKNNIRRRFFSWIRLHNVKLLLVVILFLGFYLRANNINTWPRKGATFDEYAWTWLGINLIKEHVPVSWSPHPQYKEAKDITYQKTHFRVVKPFLEHPPLFGLVAGGFALSAGVKDMYSLDIGNIRGLALILGTFSIFVVYLFTSEMYSKKTALLSSLLYATVPTIVVGSRIVQNENFFIPFWLISLFFLSKYLKTKKTLYRNIAISICSLLILAKIPWIAGSLSILGILLFYKKYKDAAYVLIGVSIALIAYLLYGYLYDFDLFIRLWRLQAARYDITFDSIYALFQKPYLVDRFYTDGWIFFGWFSFVLLTLSQLKKNVFIILPLLSYFLIFLAGIPDEPGHGWYRYPFYPFLVIAIALFFKEYFMKNLIATFLLFVLIGTSLLQLTWEKTFGFSFIIFRAAILSWSYMLFPYISPFKNKLKFVKVVGYLWVVFFFLMNIWAVLIYNEQ